MADYKLPSERTPADWAAIWARRAKKRRPRAPAPAPVPPAPAPAPAPDAPPGVPLTADQALAIAGRWPGAAEAVRRPDGAYCLDAWRSAARLSTRQRYWFAYLIQRHR